MGIFHNSSLGLFLLRLGLGGMMILHGIHKLGNPGSIQFIGGKLTSMGLPEFMAYGVFAGEVIAPLLIIAGFYSRLGSLLVAVNMIFALVLVHSHQLLLLNNQGGWQLELQGFFLITALALLFTGSGRFAIKPD
ncbi:DoxX family protein [Kiloniella majae]|uniref:DoxX family protein n=1 Tax=Kiloniella majae TaxID=1938558 RepID=UPI0018E9F8D4|nr:DoxX family protein [Kiloniella majae]